MAGSTLLTTGITGLQAAQRSLATTAHNSSNVNTEGYTRQRTELVSVEGLGSSAGFLGRGVAVDTVNRLIDGFVTQQLRDATSDLSNLDRLQELMNELDDLLGDADLGVSSALRDFFDGFQELAADPSSVPAREVALSEARGLAQRFGTLDRRLSNIRLAVEGEVRDLVSDINALSKNIATLNDEIATAFTTFDNQPPNDLLDQRDRLVRQLAEVVEVSTVIQDDGAQNVFMSTGQALVVGTQTQELAVSPSSFDASRGEVTLALSSAFSIISEATVGGQLGAVLQFRAESLDVAQNALGRVAIGLAETLNEQHRLGLDLSSQAGGDLFTPLANLAPRVLGNTNNTGAPPADIAVAIQDVGQLSTSDYRIDRTGAVYTLTRLSDQTTFNLNTFPAGTELVDGLSLSLTSGSIADGDSFLVRPTRLGAAAMNLNIVSGNELAAASTVRGSAAIANLGGVEVNQIAPNPPSNELVFTFSAPGTFDVLDETTGATLATGLTYTPGAPVSFNGVTVTMSGAPAAGDSFRVDNTVPSAIATNTGTGAIVLNSVLSSDPNLTNTVTITFDNPPTSFTVAGATTGSPTVNVPYVSGEPVSFNGWTLELSGAPQAGDQVTVRINTGAPGDNRNALAMAGLELASTLDGNSATFNESYGRLVSEVGTRTRQAQVNRDAQSSLVDQIDARRQAVSGVNLDEEAANILRFQRMYEANARLIAVADEIFATLLAATQR